MSKQQHIPLLLFILFSLGLNAQDHYPKNDFRSPVDFPILLAGTFGEPRNTHFHAGLDIKTGGVEGKNIYSIGDGYVSRIKVSGWGYGNTVYVTHTNGYTSVYAHLSSFNKKLTDYIKDHQFIQTSFELNLDSLDSQLFPVNKSDVLGKSGNTGGSNAPHLHFEIRDHLERPINPLLFGFDVRVKDDVKPGLYNLVLYNLDDLKQFTDSKKIKLKGSNGIYKHSEIIKANTDMIGFGINTTDKFTDVHNHNGVYDIKMYFDNQLFYHYQINRFTFDEGKYVLSHCDYWRKRTKNQTVHKCFVEPGNKLETYKELINNGYVFLYDNLIHDVKIEVSDFHKNKSTLTYKVQKDLSSDFFKRIETPFQDIFVSTDINYFENEDVSISLPEGVIFDNLYLNIKKESLSSLSNGYHIGSHKVPVYSWFHVKIKAKEIKESLEEKYVVVLKNYRNAIKSLGGIFDKETNTFAAETKSFGYYYIKLDTVAPKITPVNISEGAHLSKSTKIQFKISDNLSGIEEYNCFINGNWVVMEEDGKKKLFTYYIDDHVLRGENYILLIAKDERNNASTFSAKFNY